MIRLLLIALAVMLAGYKIAHGDVLTGRATVIDGDTIELHGERIRLLDVDAPEMNQYCGEWYWWSRCGIAAYVGLRNLLHSEDVRCETTKHDRYGRWLARCFIEGEIDLSVWLAEQGLAVPYRDCRCPDIRAASASAKAAKRGIWATQFQMPWDWRKSR